MAKFEIELRGVLANGQKDKLENFLIQNGKLVKEYARTQWCFGLSHEKKIDLRIKETNKQFEFSLKVGKLGNANRKEISIPFPAEKSDQSFDVAIIGGGIAGISTALFLQQAGKKVVVLESGKVIKGTTGFTTGKITSAHGLIYKYLIDKFGEENARIYANANQSALEKMSSLDQEFEIKADFKRLPAYTYTISKEEVELIKDEVVAAQKIGLPVSFTEEIPLPFDTYAAIKYDNQLRYHPRKYLLGISKKFTSLGGNFFEETKVLNIELGKINKVITDKGMVSAKAVVIATNYPIYDPELYFARLSARQSLVIAVLLNGPVPQGMFYSTEKSFHSMRPQPYEDTEAFLVGGELFKTGHGGDIKADYLELIKWTRENFPVKSIEYHWTTNDSETYDRVPLIGRLSDKIENVYVITGFNGWGMAHGTAAGIIISDLILGKKNRWATFYNPKRISNLISGKSLKENIKTVGTLVKGKLTRPEASIDLSNNEAKVIEINREKIAAYKDENGKLYAISAVCTHMGCIVGWNNAEKTWDCPCHGSRYTFDGQVIHGPAIRDLKKVDLQS